MSSTRPAYTPFSTHTSASLPQTLIFWGSVEVLAPWIQNFADQVRKDGAHVEAMVKPDQSHCWFMSDPVSIVEDRKEAVDTIAKSIRPYNPCTTVFFCMSASR